LHGVSTALAGTALSFPHLIMSSSLASVVFKSTDLGSFAPEATAEKKASKGYVVHIRNQQRNGRKSLTLIQGLPDDLNLKKIVKVMRKMFSTNGTILKDEEMGEVIQLQGDRRKDAYDFLTKYNICEPEVIKVHGF